MLNKSNIIDRIKLPFRKEKELYFSLYHITGFIPRDISIYKIALLHKSMSKRNEKGRPLNNERLEFLGDAILGATVGHIVFDHFPGKREGFLTNTRSKLVQRKMLNKLSEEMGIRKLIKINSSHASHNSYIAGNAFEALVGALYLDRGYDACMTFVKKRILSQLVNLDKVAKKEENFKSKLLEWTQRNRIQIEYRLIKEDRGDKSSPLFTYQIFLENIPAEEGVGYSKKESHQKAAYATLQRLRREPQFIDSVFNAKSQRTQMEENPVMVVPDTQSLTPETLSDIADTAEGSPVEPVAAIPMNTAPNRSMAESAADEEYDLSDIKSLSQPMTREEIIAAAEEAAFAEGQR